MRCSLSFCALELEEERTKQTIITKQTKIIGLLSLCFITYYVIPMRRTIITFSVFFILLAQEQISTNPILESIRHSSLDQARRDELEKAIIARNYKMAETILVAEIDRNPKSVELLKLAGGVFFLAGDYL